MEDDIKCCKKRTCSRFNVGVFRPHSRYCSACGSKLRRFYEQTDTPPIVDDGPDHRSVTHSKKSFIASGGSVMSPQTRMPEAPKIKIPFPTRSHWQTLGSNSWNSYNVLIRMLGLCEYSEYQGSWTMWEKYLEECGMGTMTDKEEILALKARVEAYASEKSIELHAYTSFNDNPKVKVFPKQPSDTFTVPEAECKDVENCPISPKVTVLVPVNIWQTFLHLTRKFNTEWLAYLKGSQSFDDKGNMTWTITDFYFPKQKCTGAHVDVEDGQLQPDTIGDIHSHVDMGAFFSQEDKKHWNWPLHLVVNRKGEAQVAAAFTLECGRITRLNGTIYTTSTDEQDKIVKELTEKLIDDRGGAGFRSPHIIN